MSQLRSLPAALALLCLAGCGSEEGILVAVSGQSVDDLEIHVAVSTQGDYLVDMASGRRFGVRGRNLRVDPYEHLLREGDQSGNPLRVHVLALGFREDKIHSFAITDPAQPFVRGEVLRRSLSLANLGNNYWISARPTGCFRASIRSEDQIKRWVLAVVGDLDCDGHMTPADCKDDDPTVYPGAPEICDGKDNNCDGKYASSQTCYATESGACRRGSRACAEAQGGGLAPICVVSAESTAVPSAYCVAYAQCKDDADPPGCTEDTIGTTEADCVAELKTGTICEGSIELEPLKPATTCRWDIFDQGEWKVGLTDGVLKPAPAQSISLCKPRLLLKGGNAAGSGPVVLEFAGDGGPGLARFNITAKPVAVCSQEPFSCVLKQ